MQTPESFNGQLKPHQLQALASLIERDRCLLSMPPGLGKTPTAAGLIAHLHDTGQLTVPSGPAAVYLTDAALIAQTTSELRRFLPSLTVAATTEDAYKSKPAKKHLRQHQETYGPEGPTILVTGYEFVNARASSTAAGWAPAVLVLDEVSAGVSGGGVQQQAAKALGQRSGRVVGMSGTLYRHNPLLGFNVLDAVGVPGLWPRDHFMDTFCQVEPAFQLPNNRWVKARVLDEFASPWHESQFRDLLHSVTHSVALADAGQKLPRVVRDVVWTPLLPGQQRAHNAALCRYDYLTAAKAARIWRGESSLVNELGFLLTVPFDGHQAIVYSESLEVLALAEQRLSQKGISLVTIQGATAKGDREEAIERFRTGEVRVLLGSTVLERGLNLQTCRLLISLDMAETHDREEQREGRLARIGSPYDEVWHVRVLPDTPQARKKYEKVHQREERAERILSIP